MSRTLVAPASSTHGGTGIIEITGVAAYVTADAAEFLRPSTDEAVLWRVIKASTPSNDRLLQLAARMPPPDSWYAEDY